MGGLFGVVSKDDCVNDLFYGTDYHSHLGMSRGGLAVLNGEAYTRRIHDISTAQFRSKFEGALQHMQGRSGIGVISDSQSQPLLIGSHLGPYAIVTVGAIRNADALAGEAYKKRTVHFSEMSGGGINPTELFATLINQEATFEDGILAAQQTIEGSCTLLLLTHQGIYAARDRFGRTPLAIGKKDGAYAVTFETAALPTLGYALDRFLGPGEIVRITAEGLEQKAAPGDELRICSFLWVYYGFPASSYEGINVEVVRNRCGARLAADDDQDIDFVAGIPDSGTGHAIGYANAAKVPYARPYVKYTPTWSRSFMPQAQDRRELVARMKLIPIVDFIQGKRLLFCEDSIVRGTQLRDTIQQFYDYGAQEVHMRSACPPLVYGCEFLNFSRSKSASELAARRAIQELEGDGDEVLPKYTDESTPQYAAMVDRIRQRLSLTTLKYQKLDDLVKAIGLPKTQLCTYCWDGCQGCAPKGCI